VFLSGNRRSILQESLPTCITEKQIKDTAFRQLSFAPGAISNTKLTNLRTAGGVLLSWFTPNSWPIVFNPRLWMHLEAKRLTAKNRASKMFLPPFFLTDNMSELERLGL
jgi:hypothetical protein